MMKARRLHRRLGRGSAALFALSLAAMASAQTWVAPRTKPVLGELATTDATGENGWPYGAEDVAGDGLAVFEQPERAIDVRTAYVVASQNDLWARAYVSDTGAPGQNMSLYVFVDSDRNPNTGGSAVAPEISASFDADPTTGGYEYVVGVNGAEAIQGVWHWNDKSKQYEAVKTNRVVAESGVDVDPILVFDADHGYVQFHVPLADVGLDNQCRSDFFVRSLNDTASLGKGDLNVGAARFQCITVDRASGVPPVAIPKGCTTDDQCPGNGLCIDKKCVIPASCRSDADCRTDERCDPNGYCVFAQSSTTCQTSADCVDLVCDTASGMCAACTNDAACGAGRRCATTGRCVDSSDVTTGSGGSGTGGSGAGGTGTGGTGTGTGASPTTLGPDEKIQGGAFTCAAASGPVPSSSLWAGFVACGLAVIGRRVVRRKVTQ